MARPSKTPAARGSDDRASMAEAAVREALLDVVWSNIEIPRAMKGLVARGSSASSYSKAPGRERVLVGSELRPRWPSPGESHGGYGGAPEFSERAEIEFLRMHTLRQYGHFAYSDDDMPAMASQARGLGADERVFGLLETIRVERRMGIALGRSFNWEGYYPESEAEAIEPTLRPLFHWLREGSIGSRTQGPGLEKLRDFYDRLVGAWDSREVMDLAIEWTREMGAGSPHASEDSQPEGSPDGVATSAGPQSCGPGSAGSPQEKEQVQGSAGEGEGSETGSESSAPPSQGPSSMLAHVLSGQERSALGKGARHGSTLAGEPGAEPSSEVLEVAPPSQEQARLRAPKPIGHARTDPSAESFEEREPPPGPWKTTASNAELLEGSSNLFGRMGRARRPIDAAEAAKARSILERMLTGQSRNTLSDSPSKRISTRHLARGEFKYARREDFSRGAMHIDIVVDCSGSMDGKPMQSARSLLTALSELSAKGLVRGRAIFSSGEGWMACPLPMRKESIESLRAFSGSEGIERALSDNARKLRESDAVFVYTDAQITDRSFSKSELRARKVEPLGLYVGPQSAEPGMAKHFDRYLIRASLEDLCSAMVQRFLSQRKLVAATQAKKAKLRR